jgi:hypothetical protein
VSHNLSEAPLSNGHRRNGVKDERYQYISSPRSKDTDMRCRSVIATVLDTRKCGSAGSLCLTTAQISRLWLDSVESRYSHHEKTEHRDSRTRGTRAVLVDVRVCFYTAVDRERHSKLSFGIAKCALQPGIVPAFLGSW